MEIYHTISAEYLVIEVPLLKNKSLVLTKAEERHTSLCVACGFLVLFSPGEYPSEKSLVFPPYFIAVTNIGCLRGH
jgi:hypothetical protein